MNKLKLESIMHLHGDTARALAAYLGISSGTFSQKINEKRSGFTQDEIKRIKTKYGLSAKEVGEIFFADEVSEKDTTA